MLKLVCIFSVVAISTLMFFVKRQVKVGLLFLTAMLFSLEQTIKKLEEKNYSKYLNNKIYLKLKDKGILPLSIFTLVVFQCMRGYHHRHIKYVH